MFHFTRSPICISYPSESLVPRSLLKKHYGTDTSPFHDLFEANFRRFPNFFSDYAHTKESLNLILALDKELFLKSSSKYQYNLFSGGAAESVAQYTAE